MTALVLGGSASGKSGWAEDLICALPRTGPMIYLATMEPWGGEAAARIGRHQILRSGKGFSYTVERPRDLAGWDPPAGSAVLLEDLGNLVANELFSGESPDPEGAYRRIRQGLDVLMASVQHLVVVSGDLFRDGVDYPTETGVYLDLMARLHQDLAAQANQVIELVCGLPVRWKGGEV
ncbi:MAG: bifunctional adenosylcobinamide kinase/adenosylcobinamide-phosphate guanylyltransferase [Oscillospiraceae bacterium]|nr:bifunctional adenosylcobinamide kinase/adenosylcobinamide-phosphate guanylyltransferase [Oscillospiraceae bacterium]